MILVFYNILTLLRQFAFIAVVYALVIQPVAATFAVVSQADYELADFDGGEKDTEDESQEEERDEEKINLQIAHIHASDFSYYNRLSCHNEQSLLLNFSLEILIPPPEQV